MTVESIVREHPLSIEKTSSINHDQLFKKLIEIFFEEFIEAFFPDVHEHVQFDSIETMPQEMFTDLTEGKTRRLDIIVKTKLKRTDAVIIIHVEPQSYAETDFHERMYHY